MSSAPARLAVVQPVDTRHMRGPLRKLAAQIDAANAANADIEPDLVVLVGGPRDGSAYRADQPTDLSGYEPTSTVSTLAQLYPGRYMAEPTRLQPHRVWQYIDARRSPWG